jgi:hypothetical protein
MAGGVRAIQFCIWAAVEMLGTMVTKEATMLELTEQQAQAVEQEQPPVLLHPKTREEFVLVRKTVFDRMRKWMAPLNRGWDDPALDVYEQYRKKS